MVPGVASRSCSSASCYGWSLSWHPGLHCLPLASPVHSVCPGYPVAHCAVPRCDAAQPIAAGDVLQPAAFARGGAQALGASKLTDGWYRNERWNPAVQQDFFNRLSRSRTQRDQYLVIQALTIAEAEPEVALRLVELYFETKRSVFEDLRALLASAKAYKSLGSVPRVTISALGKIGA